MTQKEQEINRNLSLIEYYKEQLANIEMQHQYLQAAIADYQKAKITIENMENVEENTDILIPAGLGVYMHGTTKNPTQVLVDIGAGYIMEKPRAEAIKKIDERIKIVEENQQRLLQMAQQLQNEATEISHKTQQMMQEIQQ